jgi:hypothetical protein
MITDNKINMITDNKINMKTINTMSSSIINNIETIRISSINIDKITISIIKIVIRTKNFIENKDTLELPKSIKNIMIIIFLININKNMIISKINIKQIIIENYEIHYWVFLFLLLHFFILDITLLLK